MKIENIMLLLLCVSAPVREASAAEQNDYRIVPAAEQPNILWIITDDQRLDSINAFNRLRFDQDDSPLGKVMSPNVDRLAAMGTTFINTFNQNPGCAPSRTNMHTGRYSHHTGVYGFEYYNPAGQRNWKPMIPEVLRDVAGYQTLTVGKRGIRAQQFGKRQGDGKPLLYETDLGYRNEFAAKGLVDWHSQAKFLKGKKGPKTETFYFPDGKTLVWPADAASTPTDRDEIGKRLDLFRGYRTGGGPAGGGADAAGGEILGGVNPQPGNMTRDGSFVSALLDHLTHADETYTNVLGNKLAGPKNDQPLFIHCGFEFPHTPVLPPAEFRSKFREVQYKVPNFTKEELASFPPQIMKLFKNSQSSHFTDAEQQQMIADYFAYCAYGDSLVGKLVDGFVKHSEKHRRPWLVLYVCGDHGWRLNEHGMVSKFSPFDTDLQNPIIVVAADKTKFPAGKVVRDFTEFVDMAPTFFAAAGIDVSKSEYQHLDGYDLAKVASGALPPRDYVIAEPTHVTGPRALIRTKDYKFSMKVRSDNTPGKNIDWALRADLKDVEPMFFDLRADPAEVHNLAFDPNYRPVIDILRSKLQNIVLGDGRVEVGWTKAGGDEVHESNFAAGADDKRLTIPAHQDQVDRSNAVNFDESIFQDTLSIPALSDGEPAAGKRVALTPPAYAGTGVFHTIYLPDNWTKEGKRLPIIFEYTGNYFPRSGSTGEPEDAGLGYGLSAGKYIWVSLPCISEDGTDNAVTWWGDEKATIEYAKRIVPRIIKEFGADPSAVFLCGFSRGAIGVNYIGLHDDEISRLWTAFITHDHFDGVKEWKGTTWGSPLDKYRQGAFERLKRVGSRPYLVSQNGSNRDSENYIRSVLADVSNFTFGYVNTADILGEFPNEFAKHAHTDRWPLQPSRYRTIAWKWMNAASENRPARANH